MFVQRHRVAVAGVIAAAVVAVPAAALAAGSGSPTAKPSPPQTTATAQPTSKPAPPATQPGPVSSQEAAAEASKSAAAAAGSQPDSNGPAAVSALAARLGVSADLAGRAFKQIMALTTQGGRLDTTSAAFAGIARQLGVTPAQLAAAWDAVS
jgi:hypothetical protein